MILRMITTLYLEDSEGNVIKQQEVGNAYLDDIDMAQAAEDRWRIKYSNRGDPRKVVEKMKERDGRCFRIARIVDILVDQLKKTVLNEFLCDREALYEEYKNEL